MHRLEYGEAFGLAAGIGLLAGYPIAYGHAPPPELFYAAFTLAGIPVCADFANHLRNESNDT